MINNTFMVKPSNLVSLTASEEASTFPASALTSVLPSHRWRSTTTLPYIIGQLSTATNIDYLSLIYTNASSTDWCRIRAATSQANLTGSPLVDYNAYIHPGNTGGYFGAYTFGGSGYVDFGDESATDPGTGSFTVEIRFASTYTGIQGVFAKKEFADSSIGYLVYFNTNGRVIVRLSDGTNAVNSASPNNTIDAYLDGQTYTLRLVVNRSSNICDIDIDNTLVHGGIDISSITGTLSNSNEFHVGTDWAATNGFQGTLDEVKFWSEVRSTSLITGEENIVNLPSNLEFYWRANELSGTTALDEIAGATGTIISGTRINQSPLSAPDMSNYDVIHQRNIVANPSSSTLWFRIDINALDNTDGYFESKLIVGVRDIYRRNANFVDEELPRGMTAIELVDGAEDRQPGNMIRSRPFKLHMSEDEYFGQWKVMIRQLKGANPAVIVFRANETKYPQEYMYYGYIDIGSAVNEGTGYRVTSRITEPGV